MNRKKIPLGVARSAHLRSSIIVQKIKGALDIIDAELTSSGGVYPKSGGRLTLAEVCRRSGVHPQTLQNDAQAATKRYVQEWIRKRSITGHRRIPPGGSEAGGRVDGLQRDLSSAAAKYQLLYQVEIPRRDEELEQLRRRVEELEAENKALTVAASEGKVVAYRKARQK